MPPEGQSHQARARADRGSPPPAPAAALKAATLKEIRLELAFITSPYREGTVYFPVTIGHQ